MTLLNIIVLQLFLLCGDFALKTLFEDNTIGVVKLKALY
jgi:hypothetical protein